jgi:8-oxo-dGTP pyrophosphatase MutT (NUDIX family)
LQRTIGPGWLAREALKSRTLLELPFRGGAPELLNLVPDLPPPKPLEPGFESSIVDRVWAEQRGKYFDGLLVGVTSLGGEYGRLDGTYTTIRYRDYLAADHVLAHPAPLAPPLALGVHCLLLHADQVAVLRDSKGRALIPGGAVDMSAVVEGRPSLERAIRTEIAEEAGYDAGSDPLTLTRVYVGGFPTHVVCMTLLHIVDAASWAILCDSGHRAEAEDILAVESVPLTDLINALANLPLLTRTAPRAFTSWHRDKAHC